MPAVHPANDKAFTAADASVLGAARQAGLVRSRSMGRQDSVDAGPRFQVKRIMAVRGYIRKGVRPLIEARRPGNPIKAGER